MSGDYNMDGETIKVEIDKRTGEINIEAFNYLGGKCTTDIELLMSSMNANTISREVKPEHAININVQKSGRM